MIKKGDILTNKELMDYFKISNSGGMRRSKLTNSLVLISDHTKSLYDCIKPLNNWTVFK
jgi:5-methylcytosine-specific restriction protein A